MAGKKSLSPGQGRELIQILAQRFEQNGQRHPHVKWSDVIAKLGSAEASLWSLNEMERTGGEPDVIGFDAGSGHYLFCDCAPESPAGRRNTCYDEAARAARKEHKPQNSALGMAAEMGIEVVSEAEYRALQELGKFDAKTSSWIQTPVAIRDLGGALFADYRYGSVFVYHNGASSYYSSRGFRGMLRV